MLAVEAPRRYADFEQRCQELATRHPSVCTLIAAAHPTVEGRIVQILKISHGGGSDRQEAVIVGGIHAREIAPPDAILSLVEELVEKYDAKAPIDYPNLQVTDVEGNASVMPPKRIDLSQFQPIIERLDIYFVPLANPDGREFDLNHPGEWPTLKRGWRKNRRKRPGAPAAEGASVDYENGVDLNRNFPIAWKSEDYYNITDYHNGGEFPGNPSGTNWGEEDFRGDTAESEPETKNVKELVDSLNNLRLYIDVHAVGPNFLWDWGIEDNGTDPTMSFLNKAKDKKRDGLPPGTPSPSGNPSYSEFVPEGEPGFRENLERLAKTVRDAIDDQADPSAKKPLYKAEACANLYRPEGGGPTTGGSDDYTFSTQVAWDAGTEKAKASPRAPIYSYTFETGRGSEGGFHPSYKSASADPTARTYPKIEREIHFALMAALGWLALRAAPAARPPAPPSSGASGCSALAVGALALAALLGGVALALLSLVGAP